jgi:dTDP-glucose 4,6-dehydratase
MRLIVTGGAGFIGTNFCKLVEDIRPDWKLIVLDKFTYASVRMATPHKYPVERFDITKHSDLDMLDRALIQELEDGIEKPIIINFAAESHVDNSIKDSSKFIQTNITGVHNLLELCRKHELRFIQISTDEVLGDLSLNSKTKFNINSPIAPNNPYAATKAAAENLVRSYIHTHNINANITRCTNNYGPFQHKEKLIPNVINRILDDEAALVYGTGENIRDWIHVEDHCQGIIQVLEKGKPGETYMFGGENELSNIELVRAICKELGKDDNYIKYIEDRKGHDRRYAIKKHTPGLYWKPKIKFEDGLKQTIEWYMDRHFGYQEKLTISRLSKEIEDVIDKEIIETLSKTSPEDFKELADKDLLDVLKETAKKDMEKDDAQ